MRPLLEWDAYHALFTFLSVLFAYRFFRAIKSYD